MRLNSTCESLESEELPSTSPETTHDEIRESPESPDQLTEEDGFVVEIHRVPIPQSITSCKVAAYLEQVHREEDGASLFETPGTPSKIVFRPISPLNDLEKEASNTSAATTSMEMPPLTLMPNLPGRSASPEEWPCHNRLPAWDALAGEWGSEEGMVVSCDSRECNETLNYHSITNKL